MHDRIIIADARKVSALDFLRAITGRKPPSAIERARAEAEQRRRNAELESLARREMLELRRSILDAFRTEEGRAAMLEQWAAEGIDVSELVERRAA